MARHPIAKVQDVSEEIGDHMDAILSFFKPGAKITVLVRRPEAADHSRDMVLTNDDLEDAIAALRRRKDPNGTITGDV